MNERPCDAGRDAFFEGLWGEPCPEPAVHLIGSDVGITVALCEKHFAQVDAQGLVDELDIGPVEYDRRMNEAIRRLIEAVQNVVAYAEEVKSFGGNGEPKMKAIPTMLLDQLAAAFRIQD